jgi:hypothetical protein
VFVPHSADCFFQEVSYGGSLFHSSTTVQQSMNSRIEDNESLESKPNLGEQQSLIRIPGTVPAVSVVAVLAANYTNAPDMAHPPASLTDTAMIETLPMLLPYFEIELYSLLEYY